MLVTERMCFYPDSVVYTTPANWGLDFREFKVGTPDGEELSCWHVPPGGEGPPRGACVVHLHGNAQNMTAHIAGAAFLAGNGYRLITFDYRGYGSSTGNTNLETLVIDAGAVMERAFKEPFGEGEPVFGFGQSMGAHTLARILPSFPGLKGAILEAGLTSFHRLFSEAYPLADIDIPESEELTALPGLRNSHVPKLFIHGTLDMVVPDSHTEDMFQVAAEPKEKLILPGVGHIDALYGPQAVRYRERVFEFLSRG